jgi:hypothetical protein
VSASPFAVNLRLVGAMLQAGERWKSSRFDVDDTTHHSAVDVSKARAAEVR